MNRSLHRSVGIFAWVLMSFAYGQDFLTGPRNTYEVQKAAHEKTLREAQVAAGEQYVKTLEALIARMEQAGDEFGVRPAAAEIKRFRAERLVPETPPLGTPEMIGKVQARYHELVEKARAEQDRQIGTLTERYVKSLRGAEQKLKASGKADAVAAVVEEVERVSGGGSEAVAKTLSLPNKLMGNLMLAYTFEEQSGRKIRDLTGRRHGDLQGGEEQLDPKEGTAFAFLSDNSMMEIPNLNLAGSWTLFVRAKFPLAASNDSRVLLSHGYKLHQVVVDPSGALGVESGGFVDSGLNVDTLKGWHELAVVGVFNKTLFYLDGKPAGSAAAVCAKPMKVFGNSAAGGRPWKGAVASVLLWKGAMSTADIQALYQHRYGNP